MITEELLSEVQKEGTFAFAAIGYGIANWYYYYNKIDQSKAILQKIVSLENWATFGYIVVEVLLKKAG